MIACSCCLNGEHVKCQHVVPGMTGGFPCGREPEPGTAFCRKHKSPAPISKRAAYLMGLYRFSPPPVPTAQWDEAAWIKYITYWTVPVKEE